MAQDKQFANKSQASAISREDAFVFYSQHVQNLDLSKRGEQKVLCRFHPDKRPSLSINLDKAAWYCPVCGFGGGIKKFEEKLGINSRNGVAKTIVAEYDYRDEQGKILFQTVRYLPKDFKQRRPDGKGGWIYGIKGVRRVLYRLPELLESKGRIIIVEGEKDVETLRRKSVVATTCSMGAGKWRKEYNEFLRGRDVVIIPDNDAPGRRHASEIAGALWGVAHSIKIISLPGLGEHEDVTDWLSRNHDETGLNEIIEHTAALAERPAIQERYAAAVQQAESSTIKSFRLTDIGNAERFINDHGKYLRYCEIWEKWFAWDGAAWASDGALAIVMSRAKDTVRSIYAEASAIDNEKQRESLVKHAMCSENASRLGAMISLARRDMSIQIKPDQLDVDPYSLNVHNGTIDLRTGGLRPHRRDDLITKIAPVIFDAAVKCPIFEMFISQIMASNESLICFLQRALGSALTGVTSDQCLFFLYGTGANGKSTLIMTMLSVLGPYAMQATPDLLISKFGDRHPTELADLFGKRFVATVEIAEGKRLAEVLVKQLSGGDRIRARRMHEDFWEFNPTHKIFLAANHRPLIRGTDHAIWRRINLIPFSIVFRKPDNPPDPGLLDKLKGEASGILNWLIKGCLDWQANGLLSPSEVLNATEEYRIEMDVLAAFFDDRCMKKDGVKTRFSDLYDAYTKWCGMNGEAAENPRTFGRRLSERGFKSEKPGGVAHRLGIGLLEDSHDDHDDHDVF